MLEKKDGPPKAAMWWRFTVGRKAEDAGRHTFNGGYYEADRLGRTAYQMAPRRVGGRPERHACGGTKVLEHYIWSSLNC